MSYNNSYILFTHILDTTQNPATRNNRKLVIQTQLSGSRNTFLKPDAQYWNYSTKTRSLNE